MTSIYVASLEIAVTDQHGVIAAFILPSDAYRFANDQREKYNTICALVHVPSGRTLSPPDGVFFYRGMVAEWLQQVRGWGK